jgi:hypothetical protein
MATVYNSNLVAKKTRHRGIYSGKDYDVAGRIFLASGTVLGVGDDLLFVPVGENQVIQKIALLVLGDTSTAAGEIGRFQILDANGDPVVVERMGPFGASDTRFTSPATDSDLYRAAGQLDGYTETVLSTVAKLAGPVNVGIRITTGATVGADTEMFLAVYFKGETSENDVVGGGNDNENAYLIDPDQGTDSTP